MQQVLNKKSSWEDRKVGVETVKTEVKTEVGESTTDGKTLTSSTAASSKSSTARSSSSNTSLSRV